MKHTSEHTCETAIYHKQSPDLIKDKCNIQYYPELDPTLQILDAGKHILLGTYQNLGQLCVVKMTQSQTHFKLANMSLSRKRIYVSVLLAQVHGIYRKIFFIVKRKLVVIYSYITL